MGNAEETSGHAYGNKGRALERVERFMTPPFVKSIHERNQQLWSTKREAFDRVLEMHLERINQGLTRLHTEKPRVSVVVPARNEELYILSLLDSLSQQRYPDGLEVIVVDNNSDSEDRTGDLARRAGATVIQYSLTDDNPNSKLAPIAYARQKGLEAAKGAIVVSTDADAIFMPDYIQTITEPLERDTTITCTTGNVHFYEYGSPYVVSVMAGQGVLRQALLAAKKRLDLVTIGNNMAYRKKDAEEAGGYALNRYPKEDTDLGIRLSEMGKIAFVRGDNAACYASPRRILGSGARPFLNPLREKNVNKWYFSKGKPTDFR